MFASCKPHIYILIGDEGITCMPCQIAGIEQSSFAMLDDRQKLSEIFTLAAQRPNIPVSLIVDTLAQDYRRDTLPRLNIFDRAKIIRRRAAQAFPQARLTASINVRSDRAQVLLAGLQGGGVVFDWLMKLAALRPHNPPRLCLLPPECAGMVARLMPQSADGWGLLLARQRSGGMRQIVTLKGDLIYTRVTPAPALETSAEDVAASIAQDVRATRGYLARLGLTDNVPLHAVLIMPDTMHPALRQNALPLHNPALLSPHQAARALDLSFMPVADDPFADLLFIGWLAQKKRALLPLLPPEVRQTQHSYAIKRWGMRAAVALLAFAIGNAAHSANNLANTLIACRNVALQNAALEKKFQRERAAAEPVTQPLGRLRQALERQRLFAAATPAPWPALLALNAGLASEARLVKLDWRNGSGKFGDEVLHIDARLTDEIDPSGRLYDRQTILSRFRRLAENLSRTMPNYAVSVAHYPFPVLPQETVSNNSPADIHALSLPTTEISIRRISP